MDKVIINKILSFMERVQLTGIETPDFMNCVAALQKEASKSVTAPGDQGGEE